MLVPLVVLALAFLPACRTRSGREPFQGTVVGVTDGDTITVLTGREPVKVRLNGIDCPEKGQAYGARAKAFTSKLAFGKTVAVTPVGIDRYGRTLGDVTLPDGRLLNRELVEMGLAWHYVRYSTDPELAAAEHRAREERRGLWADARPVAPWDFRHTR